MIKPIKKYILFFSLELLMAVTFLIFLILFLKTTYIRTQPIPLAVRIFIPLCLFVTIFPIRRLFLPEILKYHQLKPLFSENVFKKVVFAIITITLIFCVLAVIDFLIDNKLSKLVYTLLILSIYGPLTTLTIIRICRQIKFLKNLSTEQAQQLIDQAKKQIKQAKQKPKTPPPLGTTPNEFQSTLTDILTKPKNNQNST